jgi:outer membrane protein assembly factor BamD
MNLTVSKGGSKGVWHWLAISVVSVAALSGCFGRKTAATPAPGSTAEPDKVLFDNAMNDIKKDRFDEGRLALQTLINTYPDSEYLAKAKLGVADAYYKEGGSSGLTQAIAEYQDFITFFPFLDESAYAQMQIGMSHYRRMEKPDRDRDEALEAEGAFQTFLQKYPSNPNYKDAQQRLRDVQEVLAEGEFRIAEFYYIRKADRAAAARLSALIERYPLYSEADRANYMLGNLYDRTEHGDIAAQYYARIVKDYPLSPLAGDAKARLVKIGTPVPQPDPNALARMQAEQQNPRAPNRLILRPLEALKSGPDVRMAARTGSPNLNPEDNTTGADTLIPGGARNSLVGSASAGGAKGDSGNVSATADVEGVAPTATAAPAGSQPEEVVVAQPSAAQPAVAQPSAGSQGTQPVSAADGTAQANAGQPTDATGQASSAASTGSTDSTTPAAQSTNSSQESSSKKKKGLKKLIP